MKTVYPHKQESHADVEKMKEKRLKIYKANLANMQTNINSFYDTSTKQSQGEDFKLAPDKKVLTAEDFIPKPDINPEDIPEFDITTKYDKGDMCRIGEDVWVKTDASKRIDPDPLNYYRWKALDGTVYYINRKTGNTLSESTYRSLLNKKFNEFAYKEDFKSNEENKSTEKDMVNHPPHYNVGGFEVIDIIQAFTQDLNGIAAVDTANAIKYILRWHNKNGVEDLKKARWYIDHLIKKLEEFESDR